MKRKERSGLRSIDGIRKHKKTNRSISCESRESSKSDESRFQAITRGINILPLKKKNYVYKYNEIKNKFPKKGYHKIAAELGVQRNCLREWVQNFNI